MTPRNLAAAITALAIMTLASSPGAADDISRIPRLGFQSVMRVAAEGLCARTADEIVKRENIKTVGLDSAQAILAVRPIQAKDFPKQVSSPEELLERLPDAGARCSGDLLSQDTAVLLYEKKPDGSLLRVLNHPVAGCSLWRTQLICSGLVLAPGFLTVRFVRGSIKAGLEQITKGFGLTPSSSARTSLDPEQERIYRQDPDSPALPADLRVWYTIQVEPRQEEPWALILNRQPHVEDAARTPERVAGIDTQRIFENADAINRLRRSPSANATALGPHTQARSVAFLREWFGAKGGVLTIIKQDENRVLLRVDRLKREVIRGETFWEYLKLNLIVVDDRQRITLYMINDGYYAAGLGERVPAETSFIDMERDYYSSLVTYTEVLATQIESRLRSP
jgi:hypothetical protein